MAGHIEVKLIKKADDPECPTRVSIGGGPTDYHCTYRGTKENAIEAIAVAYTAMMKLEEELKRQGIAEPAIQADITPATELPAFPSWMGKA